MDWNNFVDDMNSQLRELSKANPEVTKGFGTLTKAAKESGVLDMKSKEFVALGIAIAMRCEPCIGFHVKALAKAGGSREELVDVLGMAIQMGGGPSLMYAAKTLAAWDQLVAE
ncbi:carboxymuconolactone decarboxylase family protein [Aliiruegeria sabulilitoris]|uniref:carboxymuconolactone decarboxylase family protein n=1 Tax=Aliiruegeria sabulilitoris TaxID=1510458 RepID=UPI000835349A|nr:carboxymuconolactone decarboxylase family protein [Aliiruegeria sabulilitoris]NDR57238.1 carboxymuconolactone decarboxylase family protein [Pseudoruegeria sp. M32A2M]